MESMNRLEGATSPYLLQHKDNPVDWQEWGDEAFAEARRRDVPVLLSVGYAACHWCQASDGVVSKASHHRHLMPAGRVHPVPGRVVSCQFGHWRGSKH
jgi:hypothetical protein